MDVQVRREQELPVTFILDFRILFTVESPEICCQLMTLQHLFQQFGQEMVVKRIEIQNKTAHVCPSNIFCSVWN